MSGIINRIFGDMQTTAQVAGLFFTALSTLAFILPPAYSSTDPLPAILLNFILIPANILKYPWSIFITCWVETDILSYLFGLVILLMCTSFLERNWGVSETVAFLAISSVIPVLATAAVYCLLSLIFADSSFRTDVSINGLASIIAAFTVAFKQITPEYQVRLFGGVFVFRINSLPVVFSTVASPLLVLFGRTSSSALLTFGIFVPWIYLRFYKRNGDIRGDLSEAFSFSSFFPEAIQPLVKYVSNIVYRFSIKLKIIPTPNDYLTLDDLELGLTSDNQELDDNDNEDLETSAESERRKNLAIKDLDLHMSQQPKDSQK